MAQDAYVVTNVAASSVCYEVKLEQASGDLFAVAYLGTFDPGAVQTNYLGDAGASVWSGASALMFPPVRP